MAILYKNMGIFVGRYAFVAKSNSFELNYEVEEKDVTTLDDDTSISMPGLFKVGGSVAGFMDLGTDSVEEASVSSWLGSATAIPVTVSQSGGSATEGDVAFFFQAIEISAPPVSGAVGDVHPFQLEFPLAAAKLVRGKLGLAKLTSETAASGNGTAYQLGALTADQALYAALHVLDVSAGGSVVFKVQSDTVGFASPTDRITFTAATGKTEEWKSVSGAITDDYWRVTWARTGGASFKAVVAFGIGPA